MVRKAERCSESSWDFSHRLDGGQMGVAFKPGVLILRQVKPCFGRRSIVILTWQLLVRVKHNLKGHIMKVLGFAYRLCPSSAHVA